MYGKIFESMYDGSLYGQWEALITMQQFIVIADEQGVVDMTPPAIAGKTSIPLEILEKGIDILSKPDKYSRTLGSDGTRIQLLDDHRNWGWYIVNYQKYRDMVRREDKLEADRERIATKRKANKINGVADCRIVSQPVADVAHTDTNTNTQKKGHQVTEFQRFWSVYPKKVKKKPALDLWKRKKPDADVLIADVRNRLQNDERWRGGFVPDPTTYLSQERWDDEITKAESATQTPADLATQLGLTQRPGESDQQFEQRVGDAKTKAMYPV